MDHCFRAKLRREWKTFAWGLLCLVVDGYDALAYAGVDIPAFFPLPWQPYVKLVQVAGFFLLRKWRDHVASDHF